MGFEIKKFEFSPFAENTYVLWGDDKRATIIDPGMYDRSEQAVFTNFIEENQLAPSQLLNTHCHIDHIFGNAFVAEKYGLDIAAHKLELSNLQGAAQWSTMYGLHMDPSPEPAKFLDEGDIVKIAQKDFKVLFVPGHCKGHIAFHNEEEGILISGDVLFRDSIGRHDLPGGDFNTLEHSIKTKLYTLPDDTTVYAGHGPETTIGYEKLHNPFVKA